VSAPRENGRRSRTPRALATVVVVLFVLVLAARSLWHGVEVLGPAFDYRRDLLQEYVMARAVLDGESPYQPLSALARRYLALPSDARAVFPHETPHPPSVVPLVLALGYLDYRTVGVLWFALSLLALVLAARELGGIATGSPGRVLPWAAALLLLLSSSAAYHDLILGQWNGFVLLFVLWGLGALHRQRPWRAGLSFGLGLAVKLFGLPVWLFLLARRRFATVLAGGAVFAVLMVVSLAILGPDPVIGYFTSVAPRVAAAYESDNIALLTVGHRIFAGVSSSVLVSVTLPPIIDRPEWARPFSLALWLVFLGVTLAVALRLRRTQSSIAYLSAASALIAPVAWAHGLLAFAPLLAIGWRDRAQLFSSRASRIAAFTCALCVWNVDRLREPILGGRAVASAWYHLLLAAPLVAALALLAVFGLRMVRTADGDSHDA
jgi:hypothetical protein